MKTKSRKGNEKGVIQGQVLSPLFFSLYTEAIFQEAPLLEYMGILINGEVINDIKIADKTAILANSAEEHKYCQRGYIFFVQKRKMFIKKTRNLIITKKQDINKVSSQRNLRLIENRELYY